MPRSILRAVLLGGGALVLAPAAHATAETTASADAQPERDYLGDPIVVTGARDGYTVDDGSSATKTPTPLIDVPQTVAVITADQLEDQGVTQLGEALRYVPGVSLDTGEGHRDQIYLRGQSTTADFFLDGLRDDAQYYRATYNLERVEVLKGANALIFGRGGGGGVVNRVSKTADPSAAAIGLAGAVDTWGAWSLAADVNQPLSGTVAARLNATYQEFGSDRDAYEGRFIGVAPTVTAQLGEASRLTASFVHEDDSRVTDRGIPSLDQRPLKGYDRTFFGDEDFNRATSIVNSARLRFDTELADGLTFNATGQFADYDKFYANVVPGAVAVSATAPSGYEVALSGYASGTERRNWIGQANLVWDAELGGARSTLLAGIEYADQSTAASRYNVVFDGDSTVDLARVLAVPSASLGTLASASQSDLSAFSAYVQEQLDFGPVQLVGGLRYDRFELASTNFINGFAAERTDEKVSPRLGVIVKPAETVSLYASYATSFLPQSGDQFTALDEATAALEPEKFENREIGIKWALAPRLFATAALFQLDRTNTRYTDPLTGVTELTGASRTKGFEASLAGELLPDWNLSLGYTYLDGEITSATRSAPAGTRLAQLPRHQVALWNRVDLSEKIGLGAGVVYQDRQYASLTHEVILPAYVRVDAAAYYQVNDRASVQLNIENLLDKDYYASAHGENNIQPGKGLTARLGVRLAL